MSSPRRADPTVIKPSMNGAHRCGSRGRRIAPPFGIFWSVTGSFAFDGSLRFLDANSYRPPPRASAGVEAISQRTILEHQQRRPTSTRREFVQARGRSSVRRKETKTTRAASSRKSSPYVGDTDFIRASRDMVWSQHAPARVKWRSRSYRSHLRRLCITRFLRRSQAISPGARNY